MKQHRPGTRGHREAIYQAMCAYQDGKSLEAAAAAHHVNPATLRRRMHTAGFQLRPQTTTRGPRTSTTTSTTLVLRMHLDGKSLREIAAETGLQSDLVRRRLLQTGRYAPRPRGANARARWAHHLKARHLILRAVDLRQQGLTIGQISIRLNMPRSTIQTWLANYHKHHYLWQHQPIPDWWHEAA